LLTTLQLSYDATNEIGDAPAQKRFFDVIMMGCIPVVLSFETNMGQSISKKSWHSLNGFPVEGK
jgi:hypothetical protein